MQQGAARRCTVPGCSTVLGPLFAPLDKPEAGELHSQRKRWMQEVSAPSHQLPFLFLLITPLNINVPLPGVLLDQQPWSCLETAGCNACKALLRGLTASLRPGNLAEQRLYSADSTEEQGQRGGSGCRVALSHPGAAAVPVSTEQLQTGM